MAPMPGALAAVNFLSISMHSGYCFICCCFFVLFVVVCLSFYSQRLYDLQDRPICRGKEGGPLTPLYQFQLFTDIQALAVLHLSWIPHFFNAGACNYQIWCYSMRLNVNCMLLVNFILGLYQFVPHTRWSGNWIDYHLGLSNETKPLYHPYLLFHKSGAIYAKLKSNWCQFIPYRGKKFGIK